MRVQVTRMVASVLADDTVGLAPSLTALTLDGTDARPETPVAILNQADDDAAVKAAPFTDWPVIVVAAEIPARYKLHSAGRLLTLDVESFLLGVAYVSRDGMDPAQVWRDASYVLTAALKSLTVGLFASGKEAARTRSGVSIVKLNGADISSAAYKVDKAGTVYGSLLLDLYLRHTL